MISKSVLKRIAVQKKGPIPCECPCGEKFTITPFKYEKGVPCFTEWPECPRCYGEDFVMVKG